jgi:flotillin
MQVAVQYIDSTDAQLTNKQSGDRLMFSTTALIVSGLIILGTVVVVSLLLAMVFRRVVSTNMVHIVQSRKRTTSYGTGLEAGNVYYKWPSWIPIIGVTVIDLAVSNFDISLRNYEAYDADRVPFVVDVTAFFRIENTQEAAQRVASTEELKAQLTQIVQGAVRKVLASAMIDKIMLERAQFGEQFTHEVSEQLKEWGVVPVKSMELMDIRDHAGSQVIANIMAKKTSHIEMESRLEVAKNKRLSENAEIEAAREIELQKQQAEQAVGERTADKNRAVGIAQQKAEQDIKAEEAVTASKQVEVVRVEQVGQANIDKEKEIVAAEQDKQTRIIKADGLLEAKRKDAQGVQAFGEAEGAAERARLMAPVEAQINLAKEIGSNEGYQQYLVSLEMVKAYVTVGGAQAKALEAAEIKVIATAGTPMDGVTSAMQVLTPQGGQAIGGMLEALANTPNGKELLGSLNKLIGGRLASIGEKPRDADGTASSGTVAGDASELDADAGKQS